MTKWEWYTDIPTKTLFIHLLLTANWADGKFQGIDIPAGSLVTSVAHLSKQTGLSIQQVRTAIKHLISTGEITSTSTNKYTLITICNWWNFQDDELRINNIVNKVFHNQLTND